MSDSNNASSPTQYRTVGILLAIGSGLLIGTSFVFKKKGLLKSQAGHAAGEGVAYLKSPMWWTGMTMMICGELCNFGAYAFVEAIVVTPLGALSVVISAILPHLILKEKLTLFGWIGCTQCILGAIIIALNGPEEQSVSTITAFKKLFLAPGFLSYGSVCIAVSLGIIFFVAPKYGSRSMIWYILVCSLIGGISVSCTQGLGACILTSIRGQNQFKNWFIYFLLVFVICTLLTEIYYLNVALALFNTVTPTYYVLFTFFTLVTSIILYQGLKASASAIITIALAFLVICSGIFILQMSKIDPRRLSKLDRKTTMLLQAAREEVKPPGEEGGEGEMDEEKLLEATEEPGMDALAGRFSGLGGTVVRARRRATLKAQGWRGRGREIGSVDTTRSAPAPRLARPSTQSGQSGQSSEGMDSVRARQLHALWREEWDEKRGKENGDGSETVQTYMEPVSMDEDGKMTRWGGVDNSIDGLPFPGDHELGRGGEGEKPRMLSSNDQLVSSPTETIVINLRVYISTTVPDLHVQDGVTTFLCVLVRVEVVVDRVYDQICICPYPHLYLHLLHLP
ncbi:DUF803-domain-containing protein [Fomitiporia mediterranea MF3/22]|uniref:DUF803-domain-containing protein n=1 Tax=Fomitiporia mediterranea (strain MF3/22) TaxID=694068 RepID=UPI0004409444|nr:DUF803-domain-containing protein [Fomitiporia mediterranea MF3/22]EJD02695.1 DUF803-domain-containing protein [Fomitiporia mediterranea MF3/22]